MRGSRRGNGLRLAVAALGLVAACDSGGSGSAVALDATGSVVGTVYVDSDGNGAVDADRDSPLPGLALALVRGTRDSLPAEVTDSAGGFRMLRVPVGSYRVMVDERTLGDSISRVAVEPDGFLTVTADDTLRTTIRLGFAELGVARVRGEPPGRRVSVAGVLLAGWGTFGDSTLHLADSTGAIRLTGVQATGLGAGDSVFVRGTTSVREGEPTLDGPVLFSRGRGTLPPARSIATGVASSADGGALDAALVRIEGAAILEMRGTTRGDLRVRVDDGSGPLELLLAGEAGIPTNRLIADAQLDAVGLLVPFEGVAGRWRLKPRRAGDLTVRFRSVTTAEARALPEGTLAAVEGTALNEWGTFADSTVHVADATGSIRATQARAADYFLGDSLQVVGRIGRVGGQVTLREAAVFVRGAGFPRAPVRLSTASAASAGGGRHDAALIRVERVVIRDTATVRRDRVLTVDDGSGPLQVVLDADVEFRPVSLSPGTTLDASGLLVYSPENALWILKPRAATDLLVR